MIKVKQYTDKRLDYMCSYCGAFPDSVDHVPSKILLDEPFPTDLPVVPCCTNCNQGFSLDEEYFACAIECISHNTDEIENLSRVKIKRTLTNNIRLRQQMKNLYTLKVNSELLNINEESMLKVIIKLAKGHVKFECSEPIFRDPTTISMEGLHSMTQKEKDDFVSATYLKILPEVGSWALQNLLFSNENLASKWITVQDNTYLYSVIFDVDIIIVKILIGNYFAIKVMWDRI